VLRGQRLRISRSDRGYREGLGHRRQGIRPVRRGHAKSGRKDLDLPPARSHTPLCIRTATRLVARWRRGKIRQMSARFRKSTVLGRDVESRSRATRGAGGSPGRTAQSRLRNLAGALPAGVAAWNAPQARSAAFRAKSRCIKHEYALGNSRDAIRGASCSGAAAPQQT
jgi:hypothetical protein